MRLLVNRITERHYNTVITRRDGVRFLVAGIGLKFAIPHDLAHLAVEGPLGLEHGFWGTVAMGGVFESMTHLDGRRKPHADAHSRHTLKTNRGSITEAEQLVALFNNAFENGIAPESTILRNQLREFAFTPLGAAPRVLTDGQIRAVGEAWHEMHRLWTSLPIGGQLQFVWSDEPLTRSWSPANRARIGER